MKTVCVLLCACASTASAAVPTYSGFQMLARTNFASNPGGAFNVPGSWFFSGEDIRLNDNRQVAFHLGVTSGTFQSVWFGQVTGAGPTGSGSVVYSSNPADDAFLSRVGLNNLGRAVWEQNFTGGVPGLYFYNHPTVTSGLLTTQPFGTSSWSSPNVNDSGHVGFRSNFGTNRQAWTSWDPALPGGVVHHAVEAGLNPASPYSFLFTPSFNNARQIAGHVRLGAAGATGSSQPDEVRVFNPDGSSVLIAQDRDANPSSNFSSIDNSVGLNNLGAVAFTVNLFTGGRAVMRSDGVSTVTIASTAAPVGGVQVTDIEFFAPSLNDAGVVVFRAKDSAGRRAVWVGDGVTLRRVVTHLDLLPSDLGSARVEQNDTSPVFGGAPSINSRGDVAFNAALTPPDNNQIEWGTGVYVALAAPPACPGDLNADRVVNTADLLILLGNFGIGVTPGTGGDIDGNGAVNTQDLLALLGVFGSACP